MWEQLQAQHGPEAPKPRPLSVRGTLVEGPICPAPPPRCRQEGRERPGRGRSGPEAAAAGLPASVPQGDLLFLLDSSASVSHYEFSRVREFLGQLAALLPLGPGALHASLVHVGSQPHTEFPFGQHSSGSTVQDAIRAAAQRMGDTNTGLALAYAKEQLFAEEAGARPGVPKVLVWVTDGGSSDLVGPPMQELKDLGVTVFIVSTGRGNLLELSAAASPPAEKHLHFVDVDDLHMITQELRGSILDAMWPQQLRASEVTSSGFRLAWPPLLTPDSGYYVLELMPSAKSGAVRRQQLPGNATGWAWAGLDPDTEYNVELMPESNVRLLRPQHLRVRTLPGEAGREGRVRVRQGAGPGAGGRGREALVEDPKPPGVLLEVPPTTGPQTPPGPAPAPAEFYPADRRIPQALPPAAAPSVRTPRIKSS
nr:von Willebrand factor A domain-containing protein 1 [Vicugna pacos]